MERKFFAWYKRITRSAVRIGVAAILVSMGIVGRLHAADESETSIEEVVVTATYRDTRLMDTPIAISAVTDEDIKVKGIEDIQTLYQSIPGLSYRTNSQTYNTLSVRGLTPPAGGGSATVGVYMDNLPMTDSTTGGLSQTLGALFDMERVEVLKGPQGTLYGEGNMGGALRYITNKPNPSAFDFAAQASTETMNESDDTTYRVDAMVNIPLFSDALALRLVGYRRDKAGVLDQVAPRGEDDTDDNVEDGFRAAMTWYATENLEITGMVNIIDGEYGGPGLGFHCFTESTPSDPAGQTPIYDLPGANCLGETDQFKRDPYVTHLAHPTHQSGGFDDQAMYNLNIEWELPFATLVSSTSYFDRQTGYSEETSPRFSGGLVALTNSIFAPTCDAASRPSIDNGGGCLMASAGGDGAFYRESERFAQELRLISNSDGRLKWTLGAYYKDDESQVGRHSGCQNGGSPVYRDLDTHCWLQYSFFQDAPLALQAAAVGFLNGIVPGNNTYRGFEEESLYGEVSYAFNDRWEVLVGLRYARVTFENDVGRPGIDSSSNPVNSLSVDTNETSPKLSLTWRPTESTMIYGTVATGFRPGIVNSGLAAKIAELDAVRGTNADAEAQYQRLFGLQTTEGDDVISYELGAKITFLDGRVSLTSALYHIDWDDMIVGVSEQITDIPGVSPLSYDYTQNVGEAESEGLELEITAQLTDALTLNVGGDWNWDADIVSASGASGRYGGVNIEDGNRLANAPKYSAYGSLAYDFQFAGVNATARMDYYAVDESWNTANNERPAPSYETMDLRMIFRFADHWQVHAYVRNVFDEEVVYELNQVGYRFGRPRTFGLQVNYNLN